MLPLTARKPAIPTMIMPIASRRMDSHAAANRCVMYALELASMSWSLIRTKSASRWNARMELTPATVSPKWA